MKKLIALAILAIFTSSPALAVAAAPTMALLATVAIMGITYATIANNHLHAHVIPLSLSRNNKLTFLASKRCLNNVQVHLYYQNF